MRVFVDKGMATFFYLILGPLESTFSSYRGSLNACMFPNNFQLFCFNFRFAIYYAGTADGRIFKVARWPTANAGDFQSRLLDVIYVTHPEPIRAMALSRKSKMLIVTSDYGIKQLPTEGLCSTRYKNCVQCVHDPYCGWNREKGECQTANSYLLQVSSRPTVCWGQFRQEFKTGWVGYAK